MVFGWNVAKWQYSNTNIFRIVGPQNFLSRNYQNNKYGVVVNYCSGWEKYVVLIVGGQISLFSRQKRFLDCWSCFTYLYVLWRGMNILWTLQIYAGSFFAIPAVRWFLVRNSNAEIEKRNLARKQRARALELPDISLRRKVNAWRLIPFFFFNSSHILVIVLYVSFFFTISIYAKMEYLNFCKSKSATFLSLGKMASDRFIWISKS